MKVWAYIVNGQLRCALLPEAIPEGVQVSELDVDAPDDVILDENGNITVKTAQQKLEEYRSFVAEQLKQKVAFLLSPTDYVLVKLSEYQALGKSKKVSQTLQQYSSVLQKRQDIRAWNEDMETQIANAKTKEELDRLLQTILSYAP